MCGIIGYIGNKNVGHILLNGLRRLEYRGYDSCGIACVDNGKIYIKKDAGKIEEVHMKHNIEEMPGTIGIAHTRWATHGGVTKENAHPHLSNDGKIAVVHNGIVENFEEQKNFLKSHGFVFHSNTDTEIIPNLIEYYTRNGYDFVDSTKMALERLEGQYAIVVLNNEGKMIAIRKEAPLAVGIGDGEYYFASDITAFLEYTRDVIFLEENDMVMVNHQQSAEPSYRISPLSDNGINGGLEIFNLHQNAFVSRPVSRIDWDVEQVRKGNFDHFFIKEIMEQTEVIERISNIEKQIIKDVAEEIRKAEGIYIVACGTASYACITGMYLFSKIAKTHINFCIASEFEHFGHFLTEKSLIIAVSQSGETADTLGAIRVAKSKGSKVICITNSIGSTLIRESNKSILQRAGSEIAVNSTKTYTSQLAILSLLAYELNGGIDKGIEELKEVSRNIYYLTSDNARKYVKDLAKILKDQEHLYLIGRGLQYPTAMEAAHKIKEASYVHAEAFAGGELKHGSNALISEGSPFIVFTSKENEKEIISNAMEVKARKAFVIGVGAKNNEVFDYWIKVREAGNFNPIVQIIPMQILAYELALLRGCDPDRPRNLAKCVTVK